MQTKVKNTIISSSHNNIMYTSVVRTNVVVRSCYLVVKANHGQLWRQIRKGLRVKQRNQELFLEPGKEVGNF